MPPKVIGPDRVPETIGSGGVGPVSRGMDRRTAASVAWKLHSTGPALAPRAARPLARAFEPLYDLSPPNVVQVFDTGVYQGYPYLAMELVEGLTLRHYLSLKNDELSSSASLSDAIRSSRQAMVESSEHAREGDDEDDEALSSEYAPSPFSMAAFGEEAPSESGSFTTGPESVRALADLADEPDTEHSVSMELNLPYELQGPDVGAPTQPPDVNLDLLNRPERLGRLKD